MKSATVVVIGGGVIGASVAYHLARNGVRDIVIVDRSAGPGAGSTGRATGGFRAQFSTPVNVRLSLVSRELLVRFRDDTGVDPGYLQAGYLWLAESYAQLLALGDARRVQIAEGLHEASEVSISDIAALNPAVSLDGIVGGAYCPTDGFIRPLAILEGYLTAAARLGVRVEWNSHVVDIERAGDGRAVSVRTSQGEIAVEHVVNAAGPWAAGVASLAGVVLPVTALRRQVAFTEACDLLPARMPMTIFLEDNFHVRVRDGRVLFARPSPGVAGAPFETTVDDSWLKDVSARAGERVPALREVRIDRNSCYAGLYEMSPDSHVILGKAAECSNFWLVNGSSGHGVMHSPALGQLLAELICGQVTAMDVSPLSPLRFTDGREPAKQELL